MVLPTGAYGFIIINLPPTQFEEGKHPLDMWMKTSPAARKVILVDANVVGLVCVHSCTKKLAILYLPKLESILDESGDLVEEIVTGTLRDN
eukprot:6344968-Ditylum_brightwellii.AAC.1